MPSKSGTSSQPFTWQPGIGPSASAITRMTAQFRMPTGLMGEAWFMGAERRMYPELAGDLSAIGVRALQDAIEEIYSGTTAFGHLPEWNDWYHYLLPRLVHRHDEYFVDALSEYLLGAFFVLHPDGIDDAPYRGFRDDCFATLGHMIMDPRGWDGDQVRVGAMLHRSNANPARYWGWDKASGDFSAAMFFCAKYLRVSEIASWLDSVLAIRDPRWVAQIMVWLMGAHDMLAGTITQPTAFRSHPDVSWAWSHCIRGEYHDGVVTRTVPFLPAVNRVEMLRVLKARLTTEVVIGWMELVETVPEVEAEMGPLVGRFGEVWG